MYPPNNRALKPMTHIVNNIINLLDLTEIYRTLHPTTWNTEFQVHIKCLPTFYPIYVGSQQVLNEFKNNDISQSMFSDCK